MSARYLTFLLQTAFVKPEIVDLRWYEKHYLDVRAAVAAGKIASGEQHFHSSGWLEGRLPHEIDFDPVWYYKSYKDLQSVFAADDIAGLTKHFYTRGYFEGRAGTKECLASMQSWQLGQ